MKENLLREQLRNKLKEEGRKLKWFVGRYLPDMEYMTFIAQLNKFNRLSEQAIEAIKKYMEE